MGEREKRLEGFKVDFCFLGNASHGVNLEKGRRRLKFGGKEERKKEVATAINVTFVTVKNKGISVPVFNLRGHFMTKKKNKGVKCGPMAK